ncbi:MAG: M48 family metallopeptidase [Niabella sp.]
MFKKITAILTIGLIGFTVYSCTTNSVTGRSQLMLVPEAQLRTMAVSEYQTFLSSSKVVTNANNKDVEMVNRVGQRIIAAVKNYYQQSGNAAQLEGYNWEVKLVDSKEANAWCMPGGKIVVYTGLLPITQNEAALANVMGHEVSHALFSHSNERMSQGLLAQGVSTAADAALAISNKSAATRQLFSTAIGLGSQVGVILPFSRKHELEADRYGMIWAAMAGYNPQEAIGLWQRMQQMAGSGSTPEFLSTHPGPEKRIEQLQKYMPEALKYYKPMGK